MPQDNESWNGSTNMFQYGAEERARAERAQEASQKAAQAGPQANVSQRDSQAASAEEAVRHAGSEQQAPAAQVRHDAVQSSRQDAGQRSYYGDAAAFRQADERDAARVEQQDASWQLPQEQVQEARQAVGSRADVQQAQPQREGAIGRQSRVAVSDWAQAVPQEATSQPQQAPQAAESQPQQAPQAAASQPQRAQYASQTGASQPQGSATAPYQPQPAQQFAYQYVPVQPPYAPPQQKKSRAWIVAIVFVVCAFLAALFGIKSCSDSLGTGGFGTGSSIPEGNSIAVIDIAGTIQYDGTACSPEGLKELLDTAQDTDSIKAVVLRVDSGGGTATAGEEMATYVRDFSKPIVVSSASINASAAYELSSQADYIYVAKSTEIGAIGTAMELTDLSGLLEMLGVNMDVIASAESKDSSYGYRPLTDEEREYYQRMVDQINDIFVQNVADGRKMPVESVRDLATGLPFTGLDAVENGLADAIGTREDAIDYAAQLADVSDYKEFNLSFSDYDLSGLTDLLGSSSSLDDLTAKSSIKQ